MNFKTLAFKVFKDSFAVLSSSFIAALALYSFIIPNHFVSGGAGGIATILEAAGIMKSYIALILINAPLLVAALIFLKKDFAVKTIICSVLISFIMGLMDTYHFFKFTDDRLLASIASGIMYGLSTGIVYENGGSTGGSEIVANLIIKKRPEAKITVLILIMDVIIMAAGLLVFDVWSVLYAIVCAFVGERAMAFFLDRGKLSSLYYIVTEKPEPLCLALKEAFNAEGIRINALGNFSKHNKTLIKILLNPASTAKFKSVIIKEDAEAFGFVASASIINKEN